MALDARKLAETLHESVSEMEKRAPYASALFTKQKLGSIAVAQGQERIVELDPSEGAVLSVWSGEHFEEFATSDVRREHLLSKAAHLAANMRLSDKKQKLSVGPVDEKWFVREDDDTGEFELAGKLDTLRGLYERLVKLDKRIALAQVVLNEAHDLKLFANRTQTLAQTLNAAFLGVELVIEEGGEQRHLWKLKMAEEVGKRPTFSDEDLEKLVSTAVDLLGAKALEPGEYDCIASPDISGLIVHETFGHGVEADMMASGRAKASEFIGKQVAADIVNMYDDPSLAGAYGFYHFDDEGQIAGPTHIIEDGVLRRGLTDRRSALLMGFEPSANGRRESFARKVYSRMTNTYFATGEHPADELFDGIKNGIYLEISKGGMEDPKGWGIQADVHVAREIKDGKVTGRVFSPVVITGYLPDLLRSISMVANDLKIGLGQCEKGDKEKVRVAFGGPHIKLRARLG